MTCFKRVLAALALPLLILTLPATALAGGSGPSVAGCPAGAVCNSALGVAITRPAGWLLLPSGKAPPGSMAFGTLPARGLSYNIRLVIEPYAITSVQNDARAAKLVAGKLIKAERATAATEKPVYYASTPGILIRGLPGPGPTANIVLARHGDVYLLMVPGSVIAPDQLRALASLRFIPRTGPFLPPVGGR